MTVFDVMGETMIEHLERRLAADVKDLAARVDSRVLRFNPKQLEAMAVMLALIEKLWPDGPVSQIEAVETIHLRMRLEFLIATALKD